VQEVKEEKSSVGLGGGGKHRETKKGEQSKKVKDLGGVNTSTCIKILGGKKKKRKKEGKKINNPLTSGKKRCIKLPLPHIREKGET